MTGLHYTDMPPAVFLLVFVAPGVMLGVQPLFLARRDIFEAR